MLYTTYCQQCEDNTTHATATVETIGGTVTFRATCIAWRHAEVITELDIGGGPTGRGIYSEPDMRNLGHRSEDQSVEDLMYHDNEDEEKPMKQISYSSEQCLFETVRKVTREEWEAIGI